MHYFTCKICIILRAATTDLILLRDGWEVHLLPGKIDSLPRTKLTSVLDNYARPEIKLLIFSHMTRTCTYTHNYTHTGIYVYNHGNSIHVRIKFTISLVSSDGTLILDPINLMRCGDYKVPTLLTIPYQL